MEYLIMCKDEVRAKFEIEYGVTVTAYVTDIYGVLPIGQDEYTLISWVEGRNAIAHRKHLQDYLVVNNYDDLEGFLSLTHGISLNDSFWIKREDENLAWKDVSPFCNTFDETIAMLSFSGEGSHTRDQRIYDLHLSRVTPEFVTTGQFDKCWVNDEVTGEPYLIKRGSSQISTPYRTPGREPYCEVLASQIFRKMKAGIKYTLVRHQDCVASKCKLFNTENTAFAPMSVVHPNLFGFNAITAYMLSLSMSELYRRIIVCDALTVNTDRHRGNLGVFYNSSTNEIQSCAIGFDYNLSLLPYAVDGEFEHLEDVLHDYHPYMDGGSFIDQAKRVMTDSIRDDLLKLRGIELKLPWYDELFTEKRTEYLTELVNAQIDNVLDKNNFCSYPAIKLDGVTNIYKYKKALGMTDEEFRDNIPRLYETLKVSCMDDLEKEIVKLL